MEWSDKTIAIIGGGVSGIVQAKWLLQHKVGCKILLFESRSDFGGVWDVSGSNGVMDCTVCNVSKYLMELTDFPWPEGTVDFPHHSDVLKYIQSYAKKFIVNSSVECYFDHKVIFVDKEEDRIIINTSSMKSLSEITTFHADYLIIANGHSEKPNYPLPSVENLTFVSHSAHYKNCEQLGLFKKRVLVVGLSFSAVDIAVDLNNIGGNSVTVLTRKGSWFGPKYDKTTPSDLKLPRVFTYLPHKVQNRIIKLGLTLKYFNQSNWQISNKCDPAGGNMVSSDQFVDLVRSNKISVIHGSVSSLNKDKTVHITTNTGNKLEIEFDHVIFCTGYKPRFEFLSCNLNNGGNEYPDLYLNMIPLDNPSLLSYIGLFNVRYTSPLQVIDLQAQYIVSLLTGKVKLPRMVDMETSVSNQRRYLARNCKSFRASLFIPSDYRDNIAHLIGKTPKFIDLFLSPKLLLGYYFGPITWAGYNISDPRLRDVARASLNETCDRAFGKNWFLKLNLVVVGSVVTVTGVSFLLKRYLK